MNPKTVPTLLRCIAIGLLPLGALLLAAFFFLPQRLDAEVYPSEHLIVDRVERHYRIVVPHSRVEPNPVVLAFHGIGDSTESMAKYSELDLLASRNGFILVYPATRTSIWETIDASDQNIEANADVRFIDQLLQQLSGKYKIDENRIYAVGMSNGGTFAQLLAIARPEKIAAVVAHSGSKPQQLSAPRRRFPIMILAGENDVASAGLEIESEQYRSLGHNVDFISIPGLGHEWSTRHNRQMWKFLSQHSLHPTSP